MRGGGDGAAATDTTAPTATLTAASIANNGNATVQSSETGTAYLVKNTLAVTTLADITGAADSQWNSVAIATASSGTSLPVAGLDAGVYKLYTADAAGNLSAVASATAVVTNTTDANRIDLSADGNLIAPVYVDGNWYFHWDRSDDGTSTDTGGLNGGVDYTSHDVLDGIFTQDINGATGGGGNTTDTYRYATLNGVKVALPSHGEATVITGYRPGTAIGNATPSLGDSSVNSTYDGLLAIWDGYNGTGTGTNINGTPTGWRSGNYWSATPSTNGHAGVDLYVGIVFDTFDTVGLYVALQVL